MWFLLAVLARFTVTISTKQSRNILKVCILDKVCIFKSIDKNGIVREIGAIQKKSSGWGRWLNTYTVEGEQVTFTRVL